VGELVKKHCPGGGKIVLGGIGSLSILSDIPADILKSSVVSIVSADANFVRAARHLTRGIDIRHAESIGSAGLIGGFYDIGIFPQQMADGGARGDEITSAFRDMKSLLSPAGIFYFQAREKAFMDSENKSVQKFLQGLENENELRGAVRKKYTANSWSVRRMDHLVFSGRTVPQATMPNQHFYATQTSVSGRMVNTYFAKNPDGEEGDSVLSKLASSTPNRIFGMDHFVDADAGRAVDDGQEEDRGVKAPPEVGYLDYCIDGDGKILQNVKGYLSEVVIFGKEAKRLKDMIRLRDRYKEVFNLRVGGGREEFDGRKSDLLSEYESFRKNFGSLSDIDEGKPQNALKHFRTAADRHLLVGLDRDYENYSKGDKSIFTAEYVDHEPERLDDLEDAVRICYTQTGSVYPEQIAENLEMAEEEVVRQIGERQLAFFNPKTDSWEPREVYLSGDIRGKLDVARLFATAAPEVYAANIKSLEAALPAPLDIDDILGSVSGEDISSGALARVASWAPEDVLNKFAKFVNSRASIEIRREPGGRVSVTTAEGMGGRSKYGTARDMEGDVFATKLKRSADIFRYAIQGTRPDFDPDGVAIPAKCTPRQAEKLIEEAKADHDLVGRRVEDLNRFFVDWVHQNPDQKKVLGEAYNQTLNRYVPPKPDVSRVRLQGFSPGVYEPDEHQIFAIARGMVQDGLILHHSPMLGKTFVMGAIANERWTMDKLCKTAMIVPKETFRQAVGEIRSAFPNLPICPCGPKDLTGAPIDESLNAARLQQGGLVIFTAETFNDIPLPKEVELAPLYETIASKERNLAFADKRNAERDAKIMADIERLREKAKDIMDRVEKIPHDVAAFGFHGVMVDEAHVFRNLSTNAPGGEGMSGAGKSDQLRDKIRFLREVHSEQHQGTGVPPFFTILATGTMTGRKAVDIYNFIDLAAPNVLKSCNINNPRDFLNTFARQVTSFRGDPTRPGEQIRCIAYQLMPSAALTQILMTVADTVYAGDVPRVVSTKPKLFGGKAMLSVCPRSPSQEQYYAGIVERAGRHNIGPGETLALYGEAVRVAVDARLVDPRLPDHPESKVNLAVRNIHQLYGMSEDKKGCQLIFCENYSKKAENPGQVVMRDLVPKLGWDAIEDKQEIERVEKAREALLNDMARLGIEAFRAPGTYPHPPFSRTPEMEKVADSVCQAAKAYLTKDESALLRSEFNSILTGSQWVSLEYNLFREMRNKLVDLGIPKDEIAIVSELPGGKREEAKAASKTGAIRVLIGSRDVLGKGVNIQKRMIGDHSLDVTWNPDEEWQAQERGPRVGNIFPIFHRYRYVTKNSGEEIVALRNEQKQRSSIAIWLGSSIDTAKNDALDHLMSTAELTSVISGDFRAKIRSHLHTMVTSLEDLARGKENERSQSLGEIPRVARNYGEKGGWVRDDRALLEIVAAHKAAKLPVMTVGGEEAKINADGAAVAERAMRSGGECRLYGMRMHLVEKEEVDRSAGAFWGPSATKTNTYLTSEDGRYREVVGKDGVLGPLRAFVARVATAEKRVRKIQEEEKACEVKLAYLYQKCTDIIDDGVKLARYTEIRDALVENINDKTKPTWERDETLLDDPEKVAKKLKVRKAEKSVGSKDGRRGCAFLEAMFSHYSCRSEIDPLLEKAGRYAEAVVSGVTPGEPALSVETLVGMDLAVVSEGYAGLKERHSKSSDKGWSWAIYRKERDELIEEASTRAAIRMGGGPKPLATGEGKSQKGRKRGSKEKDGKGA
jgi:N12 class adenine-specific DNA methylase